MRQIELLKLLISYLSQMGEFEKALSTLSLLKTNIKALKKDQISKEDLSHLYKEVREMELGLRFQLGDYQKALELIKVIEAPVNSTTPLSKVLVRLDESTFLFIKAKVHYLLKNMEASKKAVTELLK